MCPASPPATKERDPDRFERMLRLFLLRHGQTELSRANVFCGRRLDPALTPEGMAMAGAFAEAYRATRWEAIYSSPLDRARSTAAPLARAVGLAVREREELAEIDYGRWDGRSADEVSRDHHVEYERWTADPAWNPPTGGEMAVALAQRMTRVIEEIDLAHGDGNVLVVSHKASIRVALCALLGVDVGRFRYRFGCPVGSVSIVEFGAHGPLAATVADRSHLDARLRGLEGT
jgi:broad specificity phosphatase PhoE